MATERTMMHPSGYVVHFEVADETYMHPSGYVVEGDIEAVAATTRLLLINRSIANYHGMRQ